MLCNSLIKRHFDYSKKVQIAQHKCIRFCLFLESRAHIGVNEFRKINWLPTRERFGQCISVGVYKFCQNISPAYMSDIFVKTAFGIIHKDPLRCWISPWKTLMKANRVGLILAQNFGIFYRQKLYFLQAPIPLSMH